ncbi:hypothetical protein [Brevibacillus porteri]|uniref:hypothetical protein n=1 Tax=Brevibacillus porteri TaxID=2126350 RepID=UPI00362EA9D8
MDLKEEVKKFLIAKGIDSPKDEVVDHFYKVLQEKIKESSNRLVKKLVEEFDDPETK